MLVMEILCFLGEKLGMRELSHNISKKWGNNLTSVNWCKCHKYGAQAFFHCIIVVTIIELRLNRGPAHLLA
jgi:hypothetical protein